MPVNAAPPKYCITCDTKLVAQTTVPRWDKETQERLGSYYTEKVQKREAEIVEGKVGHLGQGEFCNSSCASFFGTAAMTVLKANPGNWGSLQQIRDEVGRYLWVNKRRQKANERARKVAKRGLR